MNEELFQKVLDNRASLSPKKKRINTEIAVQRLRIKLTALEADGYDQEVLMNLMLERGWLGIQKKWLTMLKLPHLHAHTSLSSTVGAVLASTRIPKSNYKQKHDYANDVRRKGMEALAALKEITAP